MVKIKDIDKMVDTIEVDKNIEAAERVLDAARKANEALTKQLEERSRRVDSKLEDLK